MSDNEFVYLAYVIDGSNRGATQPVKAVFSDAVKAIDWVREQHPQLETHILHDAELDEGVVWVGQTNLMHALVRRFPVQ